MSDLTTSELGKGARVLVASWVDAQRAQPAGLVVGVREVGQRTAYTVRHDCGRLRTWYADQLHPAVR